MTLVVPSPPGGSTDAIARVLADALGKRLGQSIVIENKGGGGGIVGSSYVLDKPADGHTLLLAISSKTVARALQPALAYDPIRDFTAVALVSRVPTVMVTSVAAGLPDFARLKAYIAANPGKTAWAVPGIGTAPHLTEHVLMQALGGKVNEIQYRGSAPMHVDLLAGRVDVVVDSYTALRQHIDDRKVVPVAVIGRGRIEAMSAVPTLGELGYRTFEEVLFDGWNAIDVRASTPPEVVARLSQALQDVLADRAFASASCSWGWCRSRRCRRARPRISCRMSRACSVRWPRPWRLRNNQAFDFTGPGPEPLQITAYVCFR